MLRRLCGRRHEVITAYACSAAAAVERAVTTAVTFRLLAPAEIDAYVASGEWQGKAGGYAIQGIAALFATELRGSLTNVIGLPLAEVVADLRAAGRPAAIRRRLRSRAVTRAEEIARNLAAVQTRVCRPTLARGPAGLIR
jgi:predicted house-cleaning NTP pyrophosphatase (Maf/HAM1 superfamily)